VLLVFLQLADWAFTLTGIYAYGIRVEGNVFFQFLFQHFHWMASNHVLQGRGGCRMFFISIKAAGMAQCGSVVVYYFSLSSARGYMGSGF
jgi:hypothetical protein